MSSQGFSKIGQILDQGLHTRTHLLLLDVKEYHVLWDQYNYQIESNSQKRLEKV